MWGAGAVVLSLWWLVQAGVGVGMAVVMAFMMSCTRAWRLNSTAALSIPRLLGYSYNVAQRRAEIAAQPWAGHVTSEATAASARCLGTDSTVASGR